jgi:predicted phage baseplate assembly protein
MAPAAAATARLSLVVGNNVNQLVEVRRGDQFATATTRERPSVTFEYTDEKPLLIDTTKAVPNLVLKKADGTPLPNFKEVVNAIPVREGRTVAREVIGVSTGTPNQRFRLAQPRLLRDTLEIVVETDPPTPAWTLRRNLAFSRPAFTDEQLAALVHEERIGSTLAFSRTADEDYAIETDEDDVTTVVFGDGQYGRIPPPGAELVATYRVGGGTAGNVGAGQLTVVSRAPQLQLLGAKVGNREAASGGAERESIEQAVRFAPIAFSSMQRAVTADDYVALARLFPGVSKARAEATGWNHINLFIAPTGSGKPPSDVLIQDLLAYFEDKRMLTTLIRIEAPEYVRVNVTATVEALPYFRRLDVLTAAELAVGDLFDFEKVDFGQTLYLSKIYEALERLDGVNSVFVSVFNSDGADGRIAGDGLIQLGKNQIPVPHEFRIDVTGGV